MRRRDNNNTNDVTVQYSGYKDGKLMRICPRCKRELPFEEFGYRAMSPGGEVRNQSWCKECRNSYK